MAQATYVTYTSSHAKVGDDNRNPPGQPFRGSNVCKQHMPQATIIRAFKGLQMLEPRSKSKSKQYEDFKNAMSKETETRMLLLAGSNDWEKVLMSGGELLPLQDGALDIWCNQDFNRAEYEHGRPAFLRKKGDKHLRRSVDNYVQNLKTLLSGTKMRLVVHSSILERNYMKHNIYHLDILFACYNSVLKKGLEAMVQENSAFNCFGEPIVVKFHSVTEQYYKNKTEFVFSPGELESWRAEEQERRHNTIRTLPTPKAYLTHRSYKAVYQLMESYNNRMNEEAQN